MPGTACYVAVLLEWNQDPLGREREDNDRRERHKENFRDHVRHRGAMKALKRPECSPEAFSLSETFWVILSGMIP